MLFYRDMGISAFWASLPPPGAGSQAKRNSNFKGVRRTTCGTVIPVMTRGIAVWYEDLSDIISAQTLLQLLSK